MIAHTGEVRSIDNVTFGFLIVGGVGLVLLIIALVVGEIGDFGHADADGPFSLPAIAAFIGGIGFVGAIPAALLGDLSTSWRVLISVAIGVVGAIPIAWGAVRLTAGLMRMNTDPTLSERDLIGRLGQVITAIPAGGLGEVRLSVGGQPLKYNARSAEALPSGTPIYVIDTPTATSVEVVSTAPRDGLPSLDGS